MSDAAKKISIPALKLTPPQRLELEQKCRNRLNWSDGGHWIGRGTEPNCFQRDIINNRISHTYLFPTDQAATKWNLEWEKAIRFTGHLATTGLTVAVTLTTGGIAGIAIGTIAAITKDELQATVPYPRMARGWSYELIFDHQFKWSPHPWGQREFTQNITAVSRDFSSKTVSTNTRSSKYRLEDLPDGLGRLLASSPSRKTNSTYA